MKKSLILLALVTACGARDQSGGQANEAVPATLERAEPAPSPASLTGLYEGGAAAAPNQLCVVENGGHARFGMLVWGANLSACSGAGIVERDGDRLRFRMTGDQACTVEARIRGGTISLEAPVPSGCAYYCGARVGFDGVSFDRKGGTAAAAMKARDPAGDPLCGS
jgi:hypothetical protein